MLIFDLKYDMVSNPFHTVLYLLIFWVLSVLLIYSVELIAFSEILVYHLHLLSIFYCLIYGKVFPDTCKQVYKMPIFEIWKSCQRRSVT